MESEAQYFVQSFTGAATARRLTMGASRSAVRAADAGQQVIESRNAVTDAIVRRLIVMFPWLYPTSVPEISACGPVEGESKRRESLPSTGSNDAAIPNETWKCV